MRQKSFTSLVAGVLLTIILAAFTLTMVVSNYYIRNNLLDNAIENGCRNVSADGTALEVYLSYLHQSSMEIYYNTDIYTMLYNSELSYTEQTSLFIFLQSLVHTSDGAGITQVYMDLYRSGQSYLVGENGRAVGDSTWTVSVDGAKPYRARCEGAHIIHSYGMPLELLEEKMVCSFHWNIYNTMGDQVIGTLSFDVQVDKLASYLSGAEREGQVYLLDSGGMVIFSNAGESSPHVLTELEGRERENWVKIRSARFQGVAFQYQIANQVADWRLLELRTEEDLSRGADQIVLWEVVFMMMAGLACGGAAVCLVFRMTRPLRELMEYVQSVERGNLKVDIRQYTNYRRPDEIGSLILHMENMMDTVNTMFVRQQNLSRAHRSMEMKMLLAQVDPHFIYNTLQSIGSLALEHGNTEVYRLLAKLGAQMQYSINLDQDVVELEQEVRYTENYFDLQRQRFENRFHYTMEISPEAEHIMVPRMMLQPLAENAIKHGMIHRIPSGFIRIQIGIEGAELVIRLEDNGEGCPLARMEEMNRLLRQGTGDEVSIQGHIGMRNVQYRLRLLYGEGVSMELSPSHWRGVLVQVRIPIEYQKGAGSCEGADC